MGHDGSRGGTIALGAAARVASARREPLTLVAMVQSWLGRAAGLGEISRVERVTHRGAVEEAAAAMVELRAQWPDLEVHCRVVTEVEELKGSELAEAASVLVLGRSDRHGRRVLMLGSPSPDLAQVTACPVLLARDELAPASSLLGGPVVVGLKARNFGSTLTIAAAEARRRRVSLVMVHAVPSAPGNAPAGRGCLSRVHEEGAANAGAGAGDVELQVWNWIREDVHHHPSLDGLTCRLHLVTGYPVEALVQHAMEDALLVIGPHDPGSLISLAQGSVGQDVIEQAACEVLIAR